MLVGSVLRENQHKNTLDHPRDLCYGLNWTYENRLSSMLYARLGIKKVFINQKKFSWMSKMILKYHYTLSNTAHLGT